MMVWLLFIIDLMGLFFYTKIGSIIFIEDLPTTNIIEPLYMIKRILSISLKPDRMRFYHFEICLPSLIFLLDSV